MHLMCCMMYFTISCPSIAVTLSKHYVDLNDNGKLVLLHLQVVTLSKHYVDLNDNGKLVLLHLEVDHISKHL